MCVCVYVCVFSAVYVCVWGGGHSACSCMCICVFYMYVCLHVWCLSMSSPEGKLGMSDVSPLSGISGLSFDSTLLSPLLFFCLVLLPFLSYRFLPAGPFFWAFSRKFFNVRR